MVTNREYRIKRIVAVKDKGGVFPPCGRCRELIFQIDEKNYDAEIVLGVNKTVKLRKLLPNVWQRK
jgi:cytidine deaminase